MERNTFLSMYRFYTVLLRSTYTNSTLLTGSSIVATFGKRKHPRREIQLRNKKVRRNRFFSGIGDYDDSDFSESEEEEKASSKATTDSLQPDVQSILSVFLFCISHIGPLCLHEQTEHSHG